MAKIPVLNLAESSDNLENQILRSQQYENYVETYQFVKQVRAAADEFLSDAKFQSSKMIAQAKKDAHDEYVNQIARQQLELVNKSIEYFATIEEMILNLVISCVKQVIEQLPPEKVFVDVVKKGLAFMRSQKLIHVTVAPENVEHVKAGIKSMLAEFPGVNVIEVLSDSRLMKNSCIVSSDVGAVDSSVQTQLSVIEDGLREVLGKHSKKVSTNQTKTMSTNRDSK